MVCIWKQDSFVDGPIKEYISMHILRIFVHVNVNENVHENVLALPRCKIKYKYMQGAGCGSDKYCCTLGCSDFYF